MEEYLYYKFLVSTDPGMKAILAAGRLPATIKVTYPQFPPINIVVLESEQFNCLLWEKVTSAVCKFKSPTLSHYMPRSIVIVQRNSAAPFSYPDPLWSVSWCMPSKASSTNDQVLTLVFQPAKLLYLPQQRICITGTKSWHYRREEFNKHPAPCQKGMLISWLWSTSIIYARTRGLRLVSLYCFRYFRTTYGPI